jgi:hydroxyethylthiazole kinase-like uncharacterized protein yjeF
MSKFENQVFTPADVRDMDRAAIEDFGIPGYTLMTRAAQGTFNATRARFPNQRRWVVMCGAGNNAGDGYVIAKLARAANLEIVVVAISDPDELTGDASLAWQQAAAAGVRPVALDSAVLNGVELVIDALLGTGLDRPLAGAYLAAVNAMAGCGAPVVAVDIPTGLHALSGKIMGAAAPAALTCTYVGLKQGLLIGNGPDFAGEIHFDDLAIPAAAHARFTPTMRIYADEDLRELVAPRRATDHKGRFGHVLVIGGNRGMAGAPRLSGEAALRVGAGLVSVAAHVDAVASIIGGRPELMCAGINSAEELAPLLQRATVIALGPGLGRNEWSRSLFHLAIDSICPKVVDADALNLLAEMPQRRDDWILTPHPGEAGRLLGCDSAAIQADRLGAAADIAQRYGGVVVLKGHGTLIVSAASETCIVRCGNPGMATAGMGDVLTGILAGLTAQYPANLAAVASAAVFVHGTAGDIAAVTGQRGLIATDLFPPLRAIINRGG